MQQDLGVAMPMEKNPYFFADAVSQEKREHGFLQIGQV